ISYLLLIFLVLLASNAIRTRGHNSKQAISNEKSELHDSLFNKTVGILGRGTRIFADYLRGRSFWFGLRRGGNGHRHHTSTMQWYVDFHGVGCCADCLNRIAQIRCRSFDYLPLSEYREFALHYI